MRSLSLLYGAFLYEPYEVIEE
ncbi:MAG: hypothetical protein JWM28_1958, partial [Chitinophagaceae bacterium]|nr:hypothetical protein [Chitinophagaceae bacterium]